MKRLTSEELVDQSQSLPTVPMASATAYEEARDRLARLVDQEVEASPGLRTLLREERFRSLLRQNHQNHARFLSTVFQLGIPVVLGRVLPWVYRAYHGQGVPFEYFRVALGAWRKAIRVTLPEDRQVPIQVIYDWIAAHHDDLVALSENPPAVSPQPSERHGPFLQALLDRNFPASLEFARTQVRGAADLERFFLEIVQPAMIEVGHLWETGKVSVAQEHLVTAQVMTVLSHLYCTLPSPDRSKGKALVSAAPNEFHEIGALTVAQALEADGWQVTYTGANTPLHDLLAQGIKEPPAFVAISVTMPYHLPAVRDFIRAWRQETRLGPSRVMVGGQGINSFPEVRTLLAADGSPPNCHEAVVQARDWWTTPPA